MKKIILFFVVLASAYALSAQANFLYIKPAANFENTDIVPQPLPAGFLATYPAFTMATEEPMDGWWHTAYPTDNNRITFVYYSTQPYYLLYDRDVNYKVALPVINTFVPESVIATAINSYGAGLYSITSIRGENNTMVYQVCLMEKGIARTVWMNPGSTVFNSFDNMRAGDLKDKTDEEK